MMPFPLDFDANFVLSSIMIFTGLFWQFLAEMSVIFEVIAFRFLAACVVYESFVYGHHWMLGPDTYIRTTGGDNHLLRF